MRASASLSPAPRLRQPLESSPRTHHRDGPRRGALYTLTDKGEKALAAKLPTPANINDGSESSLRVPVSPPPKGG